MITAIQNGLLLTDLDALTLDIRNCAQLTGADNVVETTDSEMTDKRNMVAGSITDVSVSATAAIAQSKLSFDGTLPVEWLGTTDTTAAEGDLVQFLSEKDQPDGYAGLGMDTKMPSGSTPLSGTGRVTELTLDFPNEFTIVPDFSTTDWTFTGLWSAETAYSWLGNNTEDPAVPKFSVDPMNLVLIPNLDAAKFTTETFTPERLPLAIGVGAEHAIGAIPITDGNSGLGLDFLGRDMDFHRMGFVIDYQPVLPNPSITILYYMGPAAMVNVTESVKGTNLFYNVDGGITPFIQITTQPVQVAIGDTIKVYAAKVGYTNSEIVQLTIPDPAQELYA